MSSSSATPSLAEVLRAAFQAHADDLHTAMPCIVQDYDPETQTADVQPALQRAYVAASDEPVNLPLLTSVPVLFPRSLQAHITFPLASGDSGLLVFSERSLDAWLLDGGVVDPQDARRHHLSDAVFIPGLYPQAKAADIGASDGLELAMGETTLTLASDGTITQTNGTGTVTFDSQGNLAMETKTVTFKVTSEGKFTCQNATAEFVSLVQQVAQACSEILTSTSLGSQPPLNAATFASLAAKLQSFVG